MGMIVGDFGEGPFVYRLNESGFGPPLLTQVFIERGWREFTLEAGDNWNLWWRTGGFPSSISRTLNTWQYCNHIPKTSSICRKDNLVRSLRCLKKIYGSIYDFVPHCYNIPLEYTKLAAECNKSRSLVAQEHEVYYLEQPVWICKPVAQSQGRGIFLFRKLSELNYDTNTIVQKYIEKPLLIGGYKFDLRLYVCIPSYHPLTIYMYKEGLARFGTDKFNLNDLRNPFRHLTNSSINKLGPGYSEMKDGIGSGCKWTLRQLRKYFQQVGIKDWLLWQKIAIIVVLTMLSHLSQATPTINCFEFFGFDILIDEHLKPWLLEVNSGPALANDCDVDRAVKKPMLHDMFDLLGLPMFNTGLSVYSILHGDYKDNNNKENCKHCHKSNLPERCKKKHRRGAAGLRPRSSSVPKIRATSAVDAEVWEKKPERYQHRGNVGWGNGKDWNNAPPLEGNWVRICPFNDSTTGCDERSYMKQIVLQVMRLNKCAKELFKNHPAASECQLNEFLVKELAITGELWTPPL